MRQAALCREAAATVFGGLGGWLDGHLPEAGDAASGEQTTRGTGWSLTPLQELLFEHVSEEPHDRMDLALTLLLSLWSACQQVAQGMAGLAPPPRHEQLWHAYDTLAVQLLQAVVPGLSIKDRAFTRLFVEGPRLSPPVFQVGASSRGEGEGGGGGRAPFWRAAHVASTDLLCQVLRDTCYDGRRVYVGIATLRDLILLRPPAREASFGLLMVRPASCLCHPTQQAFLLVGR
jgi:hypothetical protein